MKIKKETYGPKGDQFYTIALIDHDGVVVRCSTSKSLSYIRKIEANYKERIKAIETPGSFSTLGGE